MHFLGFPQEEEGSVLSLRDRRQKRLRALLLRILKHNQVLNAAFFKYSFSSIHRLQNHQLKQPLDELPELEHLPELQDHGIRAHVMQADKLKRDHRELLKREGFPLSAEDPGGLLDIELLVFNIFRRHSADIQQSALFLKTEWRALEPQTPANSGDHPIVLLSGSTDH